MVVFSEPPDLQNMPCFSEQNRVFAVAMKTTFLFPKTDALSNCATGAKQVLRLVFVAFLLDLFHLARFNGRGDPKEDSTARVRSRKATDRYTRPSPISCRPSFRNQL